MKKETMPELFITPDLIKMKKEIKKIKTSLIVHSVLLILITVLVFYYIER